jgi:hypothetical protein
VTASRMFGALARSESVAVLAGGAVALYRDEVVFADQRRVGRAGGDDPAAGEVPALYLPVAEAGVGRVDQVVLGGLPVPDLAAGVAGVGQDGPDCGQRPSLSAAVGIALRVSGGWAGDARVVQRPGDPPSTPARPGHNVLLPAFRKSISRIG